MKGPIHRTDAVRSVAIEGLGPLGRRMQLADRILRWSGFVLFLLMIVIMSLLAS